jgi:hypothetical protein
MSIVRIGLAENKQFASGYDAIFKKKVKKAATAPVAPPTVTAAAKPATAKPAKPAKAAAKKPAPPKKKPAAKKK